MSPYSDDTTSSAILPAVTPWFSTLFADCPHAVILKDAHSRIVHANAMAGALLGYAAPELVGRTDRELLCPERAERSIALDRAVLASGEGRLLEESLPGADGRERIVLTQKQRVVLPGADEPLLLVLMTDVTDVAQRRDGDAGPRSEEIPARQDPQAQQDQHQRCRALMHRLPQAVWVSNATGDVIEVGPTWTRLLGRAPEAAYSHDWEAAVHPDDLSDVREQWRLSVGTAAPLGTVLGFSGSILDLTERKVLESALEESAACIRSIFDSSHDGIWLLALDGEPLLVNDAGQRLFGAAPTALPHVPSGPRWDCVVDPRDADKVTRAFAQVRDGHVARFEATVTTDEHTGACVDVIAAPVLGKQGKVLCILTIWRDMTAAKAARDATEVARRAAEAAAAKLTTVLESTTDCVAVLDHHWRLTYLNSHARRLLALSDAALGHSLWSLFPEARQGAISAHYEKALATNERVTFEEYWVSLDRWIEMSATPTEEGLTLFFRDTSERRRAEQERLQAQSQLLHMSRHDSLTNLPNRALLRERLEHGLAPAKHGVRLALLSLDLDAFKPVNETHGHAVGDQLLRAFADRLRACVGPQDTVARLGGDEFVVLCPRMHHAAEAEQLARRIVTAVRSPFNLADVSLNMTTSVGIALTPEAGTCADQLMRASDVALYRAKADGGGTARCYVPGMDAPMLARQTLKLGLRSALERNELELFFQPLVAVATQRVCCCEALLRWRHPELGMVSPAEFIPIAEACGLITPIGDWVLRAACREAARWPEAIAVAVNLSPAQFKDGHLVSSVAAALAASGLAAARLQLEITESVLLERNDANVKTLQALRHLGVKIAMDDFGTAYASLGYLRSFPFDKIKVDQSFIGDLPHGRASLAIVRAVASIGRSLGITTAVEGVETQAQLEAVRAEGVDEAQGYLFSRPVPAVEVAALLQRLAGERTLGAAGTV